MPLESTPVTPRFSMDQGAETISMTGLYKQQRQMRSTRSHSILAKVTPPNAIVKHSERVSIWNNLSSSGSEEHATTAPGKKLMRDSSSQNLDTSVTSTTSLGSQVTRHEFDDLKCKMIIFGESLNICSCMAADFKRRLKHMEKRLALLEKQHSAQYDSTRRKSDYSAIIQKNKSLASKTKEDVRKLQNCKNEEEMKEVAGKICRNYLHGMWKTVDPTQLEVKRISGGLSNFLYYVSLPETDIRRRSLSPTDLTANSSCYSLYTDEPRKVLIRIYGQVHGERAMDAIVTESVLFTILSERRLGPKLHGVFSGGRIEEYIPARCLLTRELSEPALSMKIAEKMAAIHCMDVPLSKGPNWIWKTMYKWMKTVKEERLVNETELSLEEEVIVKTLRTIDFDKELEWLKKFIATVDSPVVFCHNDLQEGNILLIEDEVQCSDVDTVMYLPSLNDVINNSSNPLANEDANTSDSVCSRISDCGEPSIVFIDFEYCAYNYRGFDLANHFQEWGYDYTNSSPPFYFENLENLPNLEQKEIFIKEYLKHYLTCKSEDKEHAAPTIDDINHLLNEVEAFALVSHLFWTLWSIVNASKSQIPFGYWEYALSRAETYLKLKQEVMKKEQLGLPQKRKICEVDI